jgi:hypothetical protein
MNWEYKITGIVGEDDLNRLGAEGWELVSSAPARSVLKRAKAVQVQAEQLPLGHADPGHREPGETVHTTAAPSRKRGRETFVG